MIKYSGLLLLFLPTFVIVSNTALFSFFDANRLEVLASQWLRCTLAYIYR